MKLIKSSVTLIEDTDPYKMIELAGRTCYKSEDKITEDSAKEFVDRMIKLGHGAMLEHGTVYLTVPDNAARTIVINGIRVTDYIYSHYLDNKYSRLSTTEHLGDTVYHVTTNFRVLVENGWLNDLQYQCEPTEHHIKRITAKFICDRGVSHEFVRHRVFSFAQESTRYCNYSKDKFSNELTFIMPSWWNGLGTTHKQDFELFLEYCEEQYLEFVEQGWRPQEARQLLPNALKTELVMTGFEDDWEHFFELRCSKAAHPDAKKLADELKDLLNNVK